jgi:1,2-diacylglycerol 3-beta-galactosyltransferase
VLGHAVVGTLAPRAERHLGGMLHRLRPDAIVSVYPAANAPTVRALSRLPRRPPFATVVTDLGRPPALWFPPGLDLYVVPCEGGRGRALRAGVPADRVRVLGLPVRAAFGARGEDRPRLRRRLGLNAARPVVLVVGGGEGMGNVAGIAGAIAVSGLDVQLVIVTGRNERLRRKLEASSWPLPTLVHGFVDTMPALMRAADVILTKAGPQTVMEALTSGCPLVLIGAVPAQEDGTVELVVGSGAALLADTPAKVVETLGELFRPGSDALDRLTACGRALARPTAADDIARVLLSLRRPYPDA